MTAQDFEARPGQLPPSSVLFEGADWSVLAANEAAGEHVGDLVNKLDRIDDLADVGSVALADDDEFDLEAWFNGGEDGDPIMDTAAQLYGMGLEIGKEPISGVTAEDMQRWYDGLGPEEREYNDFMRDRRIQQNDQAAVVTERLRAQMPELLEGRLPADLEVLTGPNYVLGANQSAETPEEAQEHLQEFGGIDMMEFKSLPKRFAMFDRQHPMVAENAVVKGYYDNPNMGRFIIAVPMPNEQAAQNEGLELFTDSPSAPSDLRLGRQDGRSSVNAKYVVGYIDDQGKLHRNTNFMVSGEPALQNATAVPAGDWV